MSNKWSLLSYTDPVFLSKSRHLLRGTKNANRIEFYVSSLHSNLPQSNSEDQRFTCTHSGFVHREEPQNYEIQRGHRSRRHICPSLKIYKENPYLNFYNVKKFSLGTVGGDLQFSTTVKCKQMFLEVGGGVISIFIIACQFSLSRMGGMFRNNKKKNKKKFFSEYSLFDITWSWSLANFPGICLCLPF